MNLFGEKQWLVLFAILILFLGCTSGSVVQEPGPTIKEAREVLAKGPKARIAVAQFVNHAADLNSRIQRLVADAQIQSANINRDYREYQVKAAVYQKAYAEWLARVEVLGKEKAGPMPKAPEFKRSSGSYMTTVADPVAGGVRDMMVNALFKSGRFIVLERQALDQIKWEQEFARTARVGEGTRIPAGQLEGAEILLLGSVTKLDAEESGVSTQGTFSSLLAAIFGTDLIAATDAGVGWTNATAAMEIRLVDVKTSRIVATASVEGKATKARASFSRYYEDSTGGPLPTTFKAFHKTPMENALRKMIYAAVQYLAKKTPEKYLH